MKKKQISAVILALMMVVGVFICLPNCVIAEDNMVDIPIDEAHFPDPKVREFINKNVYGAKDGVLTKTERENFKDDFNIGFPDGTVGKTLDLTGIKYFPNIKRILCSNVKITEIDLSNNKKLTYISLRNTGLSTIDVTQNKALTDLSLAGNLIDSIDVTQNTELKYLNLSGIEKKVLKSEEEAKDSLYKTYTKFENGKLSELNLKGNSKLNSLTLNGFKNLSKLDLTMNGEITYLKLNGNPRIDFKDIKFSNSEKIVTLDLRHNNFTSIDVSNHPNLESLYIESNGDKSFKKLKYLKRDELKEVGKKNLYIIVRRNREVRNFSDLEELKKIDDKYIYAIRPNYFEKLDLSKNKNLNDLSLTNLFLTYLDTSNNDKLATTYMQENAALAYKISENKTMDITTGRDEMGDYRQSSYILTVSDKGTIDIGDLISSEDFDVSRVSELKGATKVEGTVFSGVKGNTITYKYDAGTPKNGSEIILPVRIYVNHAPEISAEDVTLYVGDTFDPLAGVSAKDEEDGNITLTNDDIIENNVDTSKAGSYNVKCQVMDKFGASTEKTITVTVKEKTHEYDDHPIAGGEILPDPMGANNNATTTPVEDLLIHKAYIKGYPDGSVRPDGKITRAEAAAMFARILELDQSNEASPNFTDTKGYEWYNRAINAVVMKGLMNGYPDGSFRPNEPITRAEFAQLITTLDKTNNELAPFEDIKGHWAQSVINQAFGNRRIEGYPDGSFRPDQSITRAEAAKIINSLFDRMVRAEGLITIESGSIKEFTDLSISYWGYYEIVEASNTHMFKRVNKDAIEELWIKILDSYDD